MSRTNAERSKETRERLVAAARRLFSVHGYAGTSTEMILDETGMTRGAMYHHFRNKEDLFASVCEAMQTEAVIAIEAAAVGDDPFAALVAGCEAWIDFMSVPEHRRVLIVEAPSVIGWERWNELDQRSGFRSLVEGVAAAQQAGFASEVPSDALATFLNGAMNQLVMTGNPADLKDAFRTFLHLLRGSGNR
jgi:AcrR family transcriptional regulator